MAVKTITLKNGQQVELRLSDEWNEITFYNTNGDKLHGEFEFIQNEFNDERFLLSRMFTPYPKQGIGEAALRFFIEETDSVVWTRMNDGFVRDDGSHLTEDAPHFVGKMQDKGLIEKWEDESYQDDEY